MAQCRQNYVCHIIISVLYLQDPHFLSPFAKNATANGFHMLGGKEDDITVLLAAVRLREGAYEEPRGS